MRGSTRVADFVWQFSRLAAAPPFPAVDPCSLRHALERLDPDAGTPDAADPQLPVFVFATSWRSGSTLLQRVLCTDRSALIWGEPLGRMAILSRLAQALGCASGEWPLPDSWLTDENAKSLATAWIANLYPSAREFRLALREFVARWLGLPAANAGFARWGMKEVRCGAAEAVLLRWLFPRARFVVLVRNPFDAYRSVSRAAPQGGPWNMYSRWPDVPLTGAVSFARHWQSLGMSWTLLEGFDHFLVRYEDLVAGRIDFRRLEAYLELKFDEAQALGVQIGATPASPPLHWHERWLIRREAGAAMRQFGY